MIDRRQFLISLGSLALAGCASTRLSLGSGSRGTTLAGRGWLLLPQEKVLHLLNIDNRDLRAIDIPNVNSHSVIVHTESSRRVIVIDQDGPLASVVDLPSGKVWKVIEAGNGRSFSGHGAFCPRSGQLFLPEYSLVPGEQGVIGVRNGDTFAVDREIPAGGPHPHALAFVGDSNSLMIGHQGAADGEGAPMRGGHVAVLSAGGGEILQRYVPPNPYWYMSHFDFDRAGNVVVAPQSYYQLPSLRKGRKSQVSLVAPVIFGKLGAGEWVCELPERIEPRMVHNHTVMVDRMRGRALVAHMRGGLVSVWSLARHELVGEIDFGQDSPLGIALSGDQQSYIINTERNRIRLVDANSLAATQDLDGEILGMAKKPGARHNLVVDVM